MKILVCDILYNDKKKIIVTCLSKFGKYNVEWMEEVPLMNKEYDIEIEVPSTLFWRRDIVCSQEQRFSVNTINNITTIMGKLESLDEDGYAVLRLNDDIITFMAEGEPFKIGNIISIKVSSLMAFPINY